MSETIVKDYAGQKFGSVEELCDYYNISPSYYREKAAQGWGVERILTGNEPNKVVKDYKGQTFKSVKEMCRAYEVNELLYIKRRSCGLSVKEALKRKKSVKQG